MISFMFLLMVAFIVVSGWGGITEGTRLAIWGILYMCMVTSCAVYMIKEVEKQNDPENYYTTEFDYESQAIYELDGPTERGD